MPKNGIDIETRRAIVNDLFKTDGEVDRYILSFLDSVNSTLDQLAKHKLSKREEKSLYYNWDNQLKPLDLAADYLCVCAGAPPTEYTPSGDPVLCYTERGLRRLYYDGSKKSKKIKMSDRTIEYTRENQINFSQLINSKKYAGCDYTDAEIVEFRAFQNGYGSTDQKSMNELIEEKIDDELEQRIAKLLVAGYKKKEIKKILDISQYRLSKSIICLKSEKKASGI